VVCSASLADLTQGTKHVVVITAFAKDESSILSTSNSAVSDVKGFQAVQIFTIATKVNLSVYRGAIAKKMGDLEAFGAQ
jgi:hypothetical protein